jgi:acylglycerol lipase
MRCEEDSYVGGGGTRIVYDVWTPDGEQRAVLVLVHGLGEHAGRYRHVVERLGGLGLTVYAPDHRGHGRSDGRPMRLRRFGEYVEDLRRLVKLAGERHPGQRRLLLGHSMGAAIALAYALDHQAELAALVLSAPPVVPGEDVPKAAIRVARLLGRVAPGLPLRRLDSAGISRDPAVVAAYDADPLVYHGRVPAGVAGALLATMDGFPARLPGLRLPLLVLHGGADSMVDPRGSRLIAARAGSDDVTLKVYEGLYHEVFNEPEQDVVLDDLVCWLRARL